MALNPHLTDQLAAEVRDMRHHERCIVPGTVPSLIERLQRQLPGIDDRLLGEVLLHVADVAGATGLLLTRRGLPGQDVAPNVALMLAEAGTRLYRAGS